MVQDIEKYICGGPQLFGGNVSKMVSKLKLD